jgi:hypothetical protein
LFTLLQLALKVTFAADFYHGAPLKTSLEPALKRAVLPKEETKIKLNAK